jgi:hypothetical protein
MILHKHGKRPVLWRRHSEERYEAKIFKFFTATNIKIVVF